MKQKIKTTPLMASAFVMVLIMGSFPVTAFDVITIVGEVNDSNQIVVDGDIYEVDDTLQGDELVKNYISRKVKVTGKLRLEGDMRIMDVTAFEVLGE